MDIFLLQDISVWLEGPVGPALFTVIGVIISGDKRARYQLSHPSFGNVSQQTDQQRGGEPVYHFLDGKVPVYDKPLVKEMKVLHVPRSYP